MIGQLESGSTVIGQPESGSTVIGQPESGTTVIGQPDSGTTIIGQPDSGTTVIGQPESIQTTDAVNLTSPAVPSPSTDGATMNAQPTTDDPLTVNTDAQQLLENNTAELRSPAASATTLPHQATNITAVGVQPSHQSAPTV